MKIFELDKKYSVICDTKKNKTGFKHIATLCRYGQNVETISKQYYNRTWESFTYETILLLIIACYFNEETEKKQRYKNIIKAMR